MRSASEHAALVAELLPRPAPVRLPLAAAAGRALAHDLVATRPLPAFDNSAMDGYAVRYADVRAATPQAPVVLPVAGDIPAGRGDVPALAGGTALRIMTGSPVPEGADLVVPVEHTDGGIERVRVDRAASAGTHIRAAGEDVQVGDIVLPAGVTLGAAQLGLIAALGQAFVDVVPPLRVLVLSTGSELVAPGEPLQPGQIHESNSLMLATAIRAAGGTARELHFVADDADEFLAAVDPHLADADLLLTSGGVSAGAYEVVKDALTGRGVEFTKVAMQPGMPQGAGSYKDTAVITLPGNPVSSLVSFEVFVRPALRRAMGFARTDRDVRRLPLAAALRSVPGKRQFRRGTVDRAADRVETTGPPASHFLRSLAASDCLIDIPESTTDLAAGDLVDVWLLTD